MKDNFGGSPDSPFHALI